MHPGGVLRPELRTGPPGTPLRCAPPCGRDKVQARGPPAPTRARPRPPATQAPAPLRKPLT